MINHALSQAIWLMSDIPYTTTTDKQIYKVPLKNARIICIIFASMSNGNTSILYKSAEGLLDVDDSKGIVKGLGSVFGNIDSDGDIIEKGAYSKTIQENRNRIKYLYQHRLDKPIGKMTELNETDSALEFVAEIAIKTRLGKDVFEMIKAGVISENSVGFRTVKEQYDQVEKVNRIKEVKLYEISAVTLAANPLALIEGVKSIEDANKLRNEWLTERFNNLEKLIKSNISDELGLAIEFELKSLKQLATMEGLKVTEPTKEVTQPTLEKADNAKDIVKYLLDNI